MDEIDEAELSSAARSGAVVDGSTDRGNRTVRADLLRKCCYELRDEIDPRGLRLDNVIVADCLDLTGLEVPFPLRFAGCEFDSVLVAEGAALFELSLTGCARLPGLLSNGLRLRRDLDLSGSQITGAHRTSASTSRTSAIWLCESEIGGRLLCVDTIIDGQGGRAIQADMMRTGGAVRLLHQFTSRGEIRLIGARIGGSVDLTGAHILSSGGPAIDLEDASIEGGVFLIDSPAGRRPEIRGRFDMASARVGGRFLARNATLEARTDAPAGSIYVIPEVIGRAINAARLAVSAEVILDGRCDVAGTIDLSRAEISSLSIGGNCTLRAPGRTALDVTNAELGADLTLHRGVAVEGSIRLTGGRIHGNLSLQGTQLSAPERTSLISAHTATVDGYVELADLRASGGRLRFGSGTLGNVVAVRAQLDNPGGFTLNLHQATVKGSVILGDGFAPVRPGYA